MLAAGAGLSYCALQIQWAMNERRAATRLGLASVGDWSQFFYPTLTWAVTVVAPQQMVVTDSYHIKVIMEASQEPSSSDQFSPIVLRGVAFDIDPQKFDVQNKTKKIKLTWSVRPRNAGRQELVLDLSDYPVIATALSSRNYSVVPEIGSVPTIDINLDLETPSIVIPVTVTDIWGLSPTRASLVQGITAVFAFLLMCPAILGAVRWVRKALWKKDEPRIVMP